MKPVRCLAVLVLTTVLVVGIAHQLVAQQTYSPGGSLVHVEPLPLPSETPAYLPPVDAVPFTAPGTVAPVAFQQEVSFPQEPPEEEYYTLEELRAEMRQLAWTKGDFRIVPYGILWFNMSWESERSSAGDYTLYVISREQNGKDAFHVSARATRLGIDLTGPQIPLFGCANSGGKVEIDFFGVFSGTENKPSVLLRHAYWEVKDDRFRLLGGQTWDVISPLYPGTLMYSVGWGGGNIGYRRAQLRYERYIPLTNAAKLTWQAAMTVDLFTELTANPEHAGWPVFQTRVAVTLGGDQTGWLPITFGTSGHIGEQRFLFEQDDASDDEVARTWSLNVDVRVPITDWMGFQGEFFTGENLGTFLGGIIQGINPNTGSPIRSTGGWGEVWFDWTPRWHSHLGYSIDDPVDRDVANGGRIYNHMIFANISYDVTDRFLMGFEYTSWRTLYEGVAPGESDRFEFVAKYGF